MMIGQTISHYQILEKLGEGGMGVVYKALDTRLRRTVALKFLAQSFLSDADARRRFIHEAQASALLSHANIATVFEVDPDPANTFIAFELVEGQTLAEVIASGRQSMDDIMRMTRQIVDGLHAAHQHGIVHRDVKGHNIMVTPTGGIKILDFGLAKPRDATVVTQLGVTAGTVAYMSPEQIRGESVDARTDLWALGVLMYEMIAGKRPFRADYNDAVVYQVLHETPEPLTASRPEVPSDVERIVMKLLEKDARNRYQSAADLLEDLGRPASAGTDAHRTPKVHEALIDRRPFQLGLIGAVIVATIVIWHFASEPPASTIRSLAVLPFENLTKDPEQEYFADEMTDQLITELSKIQSLRVISRKSAMVYRNRRELLPDIGRALNVEALITATVLRSGDRVRVNAQLIRASDENNLWSESFDQKLESVLDLQAALARSITERISIVLTPDERSKLSESRKVDPEAFDLVARGNFLLNSANDSASFDRVYELMKRAVRIDPTSVDAHVGIALSVVHRKAMGLHVPEGLVAEAERSIASALEIDPRSGRAYTAQGQLFWAEGRIPECLAALSKAVELNPRDGFIVTNYSWMLMLVGRYDEGVRQAEIAVALDPLSQYPRCNLAGWYYATRRNRDSERQALRILEVDSVWDGALWQLAMICEHEGRLDEARTWWEKLFRGRGIDVDGLPRSGPWKDFQSWRTRTLERLDWPRREELVFALLFEGKKERALTELEQCVARKTPIVLALFYPDFDPLRDDKRFANLVAKAELPVDAYCALPR